MPATHVVTVSADLPAYTVLKNGVEEPVQILQRRDDEVYVHYLNLDKRLDEWVPKESCKQAVRDGKPVGDSVAGSAGAGTGGRKRKRGAGRAIPSATATAASPAPSLGGLALEAHPNDSRAAAAAAPGEITMTEEDFDIEHHKKITAQRNFDKVHFGEWQIKTWYFSPYPLTEAEADELTLSEKAASSQSSHSFKIPGVHRTSARSHGRTSDLLAGGLGRTHGGERSLLWVCDMCFKYMSDPASYELHKRNCAVKRPPGERKVYQRGAHTIWEVDGAKEKLYCQNLSLFGKLFIDVKTLFFDCDNFLFYILTDASSTQDHMLGFFSKEKVSYDDYNLACIMTLPPYQRKGYGMLMIEFSYELSRRAGKIGTPERPLSDLGLRSYLTYWVSTLIRFFRRALSVLPPERSMMSSIGTFPDLHPASSENGDENGTTLRRRKKVKGWDGEADPSLEMIPLSVMDDPLFTTQRMFETRHREDGGAETHVSVRCTLSDIARATNLRVEDAAFALNECGLLMRRLSDVAEGDTVVVTRTMVEKVAAERNVKRPCMDLAYVLL